MIKKQDNSRLCISLLCGLHRPWCQFTQLFSREKQMKAIEATISVCPLSADGQQITSGYFKSTRGNEEAFSFSKKCAKTAHPGKIWLHIRTLYVPGLGVWSRSDLSGSWPFSIMASLGARHIAQVAMSHYTHSYFCFDHLQPSIMFGRHMALGPRVVVSPFKIIVSLGGIWGGVGTGRGLHHTWPELLLSYRRAHHSAASDHHSSHHSNRQRHYQSNYHKNPIWSCPDGIAHTHYWDLYE